MKTTTITHDVLLYKNHWNRPYIYTNRLADLPTPSSAHGVQEVLEKMAEIAKGRVRAAIQMKSEEENVLHVLVVHIETIDVPAIELFALEQACLEIGVPYKVFFKGEELKWHVRKRK